MRWLNIEITMPIWRFVLLVMIVNITAVVVTRLWVGH